MTITDDTPAGSARQPREYHRGRYEAHVPRHLDVPALVAKHGRPGWADLARWVISAVYIQRRTWRARSDQYVPLSSKYLKRHVGQWSYAELVQILTDEGVLECDGVCKRPKRDQQGKVVQRGKCYYFRLTAAYRDGPFEAVPITHPDLTQRITREYEREREEVDKDDLLKALRDMHDLVTVAPDAPDVDDLEPFRPGGHRRFTVCDQGRIHSNVANLRKEYRSCVRLNGRKLKAVDASCSQPLLLALLLTRPLPEGGGFPSYPSVSYSSGDCQSFYRDCEEATLYDSLVKEYGVPRDDVKLGVLRAMYDNPHILEHPERRPMWTDEWTPEILAVCQAFMRKYPGVFAAVKAYWKQLGRGGLPRLMQTLESHMFIRRVAGRLVAEHRDVCFLTQHDAILVASGHTELVKRIIEQEFRSAFGVCPELKVGDWAKSDAGALVWPVGPENVPDDVGVALAG